MSTCPRCHQPIAAQAVECPHCQMTLKAFGHPGIPLFHAAPGETLCPTCLYHLDDSCTFPQRPDAQNCTLYVTPQQVTQFTQARAASARPVYGARRQQRYLVWLVLAGLVLVSILVAL